MDIALDGLVLATAWLHTVASPYSKVEESFNLHAVHDVLMYGVGGVNLDKVGHERAQSAHTNHLASTTTLCSLAPCPGRSLEVYFWRGQRRQSCTLPRSWGSLGTSLTFRSSVSLDICSPPFDI